jgi:hypothetical protein
MTSLNSGFDMQNSSNFPQKSADSIVDKKGVRVASGVAEDPLEFVLSLRKGEFTVSEQGQIVDKFIVPPNRRSCWVDALKEIIKEASHKVGEIPTVSASSY